MNNFKSYKIQIKPLSSFITPIQADTIWGSFCWALKYIKGETELEEFLNTYKESVPLILSSGIPDGFIFKPILKPAKTESINNLIKKIFGTDKKENIRRIKKLKNIKAQIFIPLIIFQKIKDSLNEENLLENLFYSKNNHPVFNFALVFRNTINRITGNVKIEGGLHPHKEIFFSSDIKINIFLKTNYFNINDLYDIFNFISISGFGRYSSTGKGAFKINEIKEEEIDFSVSNPNAFMSLSNFVPSGNDPKNGFYNLITKWGKLGGDFARGSVPFKKPIIMMTEGSTFYDEKIKEYYGLLLENIHKNKKIKHYAFSFPLGVNINENL